MRRSYRTWPLAAWKLTVHLVVWPSTVPVKVVRLPSSWSTPFLLRE